MRHLSKRHAGYALLVALTSLTACMSSTPDLDQTWGLAEERVAHERGADVTSPSRDGHFSVTVPMGLTRHAFALVARDHLSLGAGSVIIGGNEGQIASGLAYVASFGSMRIAAGARLTSIYALGTGPLLIEPGVRVGGYVKTASRSPQLPPDVGSLGVMFSAPAMAEEFRWKVDFAAGSENRLSDPGEAAPLDVPPGRYDRLVVERNSTMVIRSGEYVVGSLEVKALGTLNIDNLNAPVYVWIRDALVQNGEIFEYARRPNVLFGYAGAVAPTLGGAFRGTLLSPNADVAVPKSTEAHRGSFFARNIAVADGATIQFASFVGTEGALAPSSVVCGFCGLAARRAMRDDCCNGVGRHVSDVASSAAVCASGCAATSVEEAPACREQCAAFVSPDVLGAQAELSDCLERIWSVYVGCEAWYSYWPRACAKLGYPVSREFSCASPSDEILSTGQ